MSDYYGDDYRRNDRDGRRRRDEHRLRERRDRYRSDDNEHTRHGGETRMQDSSHEWPETEQRARSRQGHRERHPKERRNRIPALIVLVIVVLVLVFAGTIGASPEEAGEPGTGGVPFKLLPVLPSNLGAETESAVTTLVAEPPAIDESSSSGSR